MQTFDLHDVIAARMARFKGVAWQVAEDLPRTFAGDARAEMALLEKLLEHAVGSANGAEVVVDVRRDLGNRVRFEVAHRGAGMTPEASLHFVADLDPDLGIHTAPHAGSTVWFFAHLRPA